MRGVIFVGSNPSNVGPDSPAMKNLHHWVITMGGGSHFWFTNVSDETTPNNRPLKKSEYKLEQLKETVTEHNCVVALGNTAADALTKIDVPHFKLPHPSPKNRKLNDTQYVSEVLEECRRYINANRNG